MYLSSLPTDPCFFYEEPNRPFSPAIEGDFLETNSQTFFDNILEKTDAIHPSDIDYHSSDLDTDYHLLDTESSIPSENTSDVKTDDRPEDRPVSFEDLILLGNRYYANAQPEAAIVSYLSALSTANISEEQKFAANLLIVDCYIVLDNPTHAFFYLKQALSLKTIPFEKKLHAISFISEKFVARKQLPSDEQKLFNSAEQYYKNEKFVEAFYVLSYLRKMSSEKLLPFQEMLVNCLIHLQLTDFARQVSCQVISDSNYQERLFSYAFNLAKNFYHKNKPLLKTKLFEIYASPGIASETLIFCEYYLGLIFQGELQHKLAEEFYLSALKRTEDPSKTFLLFHQLAIINLTKQIHEKFEFFIIKAIKTNEGSSALKLNCHLLYANYLLNTSNKSLAITYFKRALTFFETNFTYGYQINCMLSQAFFFENSINESFRFLKAAWSQKKVESLNFEHEIYEILANFFIGSGKPRIANICFIKCLEHAPSSSLSEIKEKIEHLDKTVGRPTLGEIFLESSFLPQLSEENLKQIESLRPQGPYQIVEYLNLAKMISESKDFDILAHFFDKTLNFPFTPFEKLQFVSYFKELIQKNKALSSDDNFLFIIGSILTKNAEKEAIPFLQNILTKVRSSTLKIQIHYLLSYCYQKRASNQESDFNQLVHHHISRAYYLCKVNKLPNDKVIFTYCIFLLRQRNFKLLSDVLSEAFFQDKNLENELFERIALEILDENQVETVLDNLLLLSSFINPNELLYEKMGFRPLVQ